MSETTEPMENAVKPEEPVGTGTEGEGQAEPAPFDRDNELRAELAALREEQHKQRRMLLSIQDVVRGRLLEPVLRDAILLIDRIEQLTDEVDRQLHDPRHAQRPDIIRALGWAKRKILEGLETECLEILTRARVVRIEFDGNRFDPRQQRAVKSVLVADPEQDGAVVELLRHGYQFESGHIVRAADVAVGRYRSDQQRKERTEDA